MLEPIALAYLRAVVDSGSIVSAAEELRVAGSAISRQIALLEHEMGVSLFERHPRGMTPTPAGRAAYDFAVRQHEEARALRQAVVSGEQLTGQVRVSSVEGVLHALLPGWIEQLLTEHPGIHVAVIQRSSDGVRDALVSGETDLGFVFGPAARADLVSLGAMTMPVGLAVRDDGPFSSSDGYSVSDLEGMDVVLPDATFGIRHEVERALSRAGVALRCRLETNSLRYAAQMTASTGMPTFTTKEIIEAVGSPRLRLVPLRDSALETTRSTLLSRGPTLGPVQAEVREFFRRRVRRYGGGPGSSPGRPGGR